MESASSRRSRQSETRRDSASAANYTRMYNDNQNIYADAQQPQQQRRASRSPPPALNRVRGDKKCTYRIPNNNDTSITTRCTNGKHSSTGTNYACRAHGKVMDMLVPFNYTNDNNGLKFLHYYKNVPLDSDALAAIFKDANGQGSGEIGTTIPIPKNLQELLDVDFEGTAYHMRTTGVLIYYLLPDELAVINMKALTEAEGSTIDGGGSTNTQTALKRVFDDTVGHPAFVKFFIHFQEIERRICSVGEDPLDIGILARLEGMRLHATGQLPLPPPVGGTMMPYGWKYSHHRAGDHTLKSMYFPPGRVETPFEIRSSQYVIPHKPSNPTSGVHANQISTYRAFVKVQHHMYGYAKEEDEDDESTSSSSSSNEVSWQRKSQEVVFLKDEKKPQITEDIAVIDVSPVDVTMGLIPMFFERVAGNAALICMMKDKLEEYKAGNYEEQRSILLEILKVLRGKGARILRVNRNSLPAEEDDDTSGVTFDDVGGQFFVYHLGPFLYSFHLKAAPKEEEYKWGDLPMYHQLIAESIMAETDEDGDGEMKMDDLLDSVGDLYDVRTVNQTEDDDSSESDDSLNSDLISKSDDESDADYIYNSESEFSDSELEESSVED